MSNPARRDFLKVAGVGAAAAGATVLASGQAAHASAQSASLPADAHRHEILAHVKDARTGRITVMVEGREVEIVDHALVAKLAHAVSTKD